MTRMRMPAIAKEKTLRDSQREATRKAILEAALSSFAEHGYAGSSTRSIATLARVHHALIKYHFHSKEALWKDAVALLFEQQAIELRNRTPMDRVNTREGRRLHAREILRQFVLYSARHPEHARLMVQESVRDSARLRWVADTYITRTAKAAQAFVQLLKKDKLIADVSDLALCYIIAGAAQTIYTLAPEVRRVWKVDPSHEAVIESHIEAMLAVFIP
jgi:TetR/AcrR family transcriptional regulator